MGLNINLFKDNKKSNENDNKESKPISDIEDLEYITLDELIKRCEED